MSKTLRVRNRLDVIRTALDYFVEHDPAARKVANRLQR